jgi:4-hydroxybenzoate polyprenyltransferase
VWWSAQLGPIFLAGIAAVAGLLVLEHWLVREQDPARINLAFFHVNSIVSIGVLALICADVLLV